MLNLKNGVQDNCPYCRMPYTAKNEGEYSYQKIIDIVVGEHFQVYQQAFGDKEITTEFFQQRKKLYKQITTNIAIQLDCEVVSDDDRQIFSILYKGMVIPIEWFYYLN